MIVWHKIFAYSPDKRYRMNRYTGVVEEQKIIRAYSPEAGGFIIWDPLGKVMRKQFVLENWTRKNEVDIRDYIWDVSG